MRSLFLLAACALLLVHGARAACKADKPDEDPVSGCAKCGPDGAKCLECSEFFGLASNGTCVRCKAPGYYGDRCSKCDGNNPTICLVCKAACGRRSCTGLFASEGRCELCGESCADCDPKGACTSCNRFHGLVNNTCQHCAENCVSCGDDATKCEGCQSGFRVAENGTCVACPGGGVDGGVSECDASGKPTSCNYDYFLKDGACTKCPPNCSSCDDQTGACNSCIDGFGPSKKGATDCVACKSANCTACYEESSTCTSCNDGFGLVGGACQRCASANSVNTTCSICDGNTKVCTSCAADGVPVGIDKATGGCGPCAAANCYSCSDDTTKCTYCNDGFGLDEKAGTCKPCPAQATACTVNATGTFIDSCARGYGLDAATGQCKACGIENCEYCDKLGAGFCDVFGCKEGFGYSDKENTCFACPEGCGACSEVDTCSYCISNWSFADATEKTCTKCVDGDKRSDCETSNSA